MRILPSRKTDYVIIGAGIAGSSLAAELAAGGAKPLVLEREARPGYHSTGRSAALFSAVYGSPIVRALSRASLPFFTTPPAGFAAHSLRRPRGLMMVAGEEQRAILDRLVASDDMAKQLVELDAAEVSAKVPILRREQAMAALYEANAFDLDVAALHEGYLRQLRASGASLLCDCEIETIERTGYGWQLQTNHGEISAAILINAAGAWVDAVAQLAGIARLGITPTRRTALLVPAPSGANTAEWPLVTDVSSTLYFKPESGKLLLSPMDETPIAACDAMPDEMDVALAVDRFEQLTTEVVHRVSHQWAGLRSFTPDMMPVAGFAPAARGFFWLAGHGGFGIQTAPALARASAAIVQGRALPADISDAGVEVSLLRPERLEPVRPAMITAVVEPP